MVEVPTAASKYFEQFETHFHLKPISAECGTGSVRCKDGKCVPGARCDRTYDCLDGSDELNCTNYCDISEFQCHSGQCIDERLRCDGLNDCKDGSDEQSCGRFFKCELRSFDLNWLWSCRSSNTLSFFFVFVVFACIYLNLKIKFETFPVRTNIICISVIYSKFT